MGTVLRQCSQPCQTQHDFCRNVLSYLAERGWSFVWDPSALLPSETCPAFASKKEMQERWLKSVICTQFKALLHRRRLRLFSKTSIMRHCTKHNQPGWCTRLYHYLYFQVTSYHCCTQHHSLAQHGWLHMHFCNYCHTNGSQPLGLRSSSK